MTPNFGKNILITGSSRGIGFGMVEYLAKHSNAQYIFATCRNPENAKALKELSKLYLSIKIVQLDIEDDNSIEKARNEIQAILEDQLLNMLVNNAGLDLTGGTILGEKPNRTNLNRQFDINTTSTIIVTDAFLPLLLKAAENGEKAMIVNMSSALGSITNAWRAPENDTGRFWYAYNMSKAALNMYTRVLNRYHENKGLIVVSIHPGRVKTDMGGPIADITTEESVQAMIDSLSKLATKDSGRCIDRFGKDIPF